jgi:hypothetical protein
MSTSGITTYQLTANQIINAAMRKIGIMAKGQVADTEELTVGLQALNALITMLRVKGMQLWKLTTATLTLVTDTQTYTLTQPNKPFKVLQAWISPTSSGSKIPVEITSLFNYNLLPSTSSGVPIKLAYTPGNTTGVISVWPKPTTTIVSGYTFYYTYQKEFDIVSTDSETLDFPAEWTNALIYGTAYLIAGESNVPLQDRQMLKKDFDDFVGMAQEGGTEDASLFFQPYTDR